MQQLDTWQIECKNSNSVVDRLSEQVTVDKVKVARVSEQWQSTECQNSDSWQCQNNTWQLTEWDQVTVDKVSAQWQLTQCQHSDGLTSVAGGWHSIAVYRPPLWRRGDTCCTGTPSHSPSSSLQCCEWQCLQVQASINTVRPHYYICTYVYSTIQRLSIHTYIR